MIRLVINYLVLISCSVSITLAQPNHPQIVVHRGANHLAPENTMASTLKCVELGTDYVEVDVRMSRDGVFYVLHDETLDRTTNGTGYIKDKLASEIDQLDAGSWYHEDFKGEKVPRLKSLLLEIRGEVKIYFDVKQADLEKLIELVYETGFEHDSFFWFGDHKQTELFRELNENLALKMNARDIADLRAALKYNPEIIECGVKNLSADFIDLCKQHNLKIMIYGKDTKKAYREVINSVADMVNLNKPELMLELLKEQQH